MNYELELEAKKKELAELEQKVEKLRINGASLKVGQCFKRKQNQSDKNYQCYMKLLYVDKSGFGYTLVIDERCICQPLRLFQGPSFDTTIKLPEQDAFVAVGQAYNFESDLDFYEEITEGEYNQAKQRILALITNPKVPKNWVEASSSFGGGKKQP